MRGGERACHRDGKNRKELLFWVKTHPVHQA